MPSLSETALTISPSASSNVQECVRAHLPQPVHGCRAEGTEINWSSAPDASAMGWIIWSGPSSFRSSVFSTRIFIGNLISFFPFYCHHGIINKLWVLSSVGRALPWRGRGHGFESLSAHSYLIRKPHKYVVFYFYLTKEISEHIAEISEKAIAYLRHSIARKVITKRFGKWISYGQTAIKQEP